MEKKKVFIIDEESHGPIGVATSPKSAMRWLMDEGWIDKYSVYSIWDGEKWEHFSIAEYCEQNGLADWQRWLMDNASVKLLETGFLIYLREVDLAETE